jgi:hypothetical protein
MNHAPDLDTRLDEALDESFPASDPPAVHSIDDETSMKRPGPAPSHAPPYTKVPPPAKPTFL